MGSDEIAEEALQLPEDQRVSLAHRLLSSIEPPGSPEVEAAWDHEIRRRIAAYDCGQMVSIPAGQVFDEVERQLSK